MSDNAKWERYAYLIVIKTGYQYSAGTTSNVGIKIVGNRYASKVPEKHIAKIIISRSR